MDWQQGFPGASWDQPLFAADGHFLQSSYWAAFQSALGKKIFYDSGPNWQCLAILEQSRFANRLYCPYGPLATSKKGLSAALAALQNLASQQQAVFVRLEPLAPLKEADLAAAGLKPALKDIQQRLTWVQDLTKPTDQILAELSATNRNLYNTYKNKGITIKASRVPANMDIFIKMMHEVAQVTGIRPHSDHYYQTMADVLVPKNAAKIYLAIHNGQPIASAFVLDSPTTRYYLHAASYSANRKLHPGSPLVAQMMFDAKQNGQRQFDFCGVAPPGQPNHRWAGFTKFKQSFGGEYKAYLGTWELPANSLMYGVYRTAYKARKLLG